MEIMDLGKRPEHKKSNDLKFYTAKMPRNPNSDPKIPGIVIILTTSPESLAEKDPQANAEMLFKCLSDAVDHDVLVELRWLLPQS